MIRLVNAIALAGWFLFDLTRSSVAVARVVLSARTAPRPRFVVVPLRVRSDAAITLVAAFVVRFVYHALWVYAPKRVAAAAVATPVAQSTGRTLES